MHARTDQSSSQSHLRFVVLHHTGWARKDDHYDLLLEYRAAESADDRNLKAFSTAENIFPTGMGAGDEMIPAEDHRNAYLRYEGPVSRERGNVARKASGSVQFRELSPTKLVILLVSNELCGIYALHNHSDKHVRFIKID